MPRELYIVNHLHQRLLSFFSLVSLNNVTLLSLIPPAFPDFPHNTRMPIAGLYHKTWKGEKLCMFLVASAVQLNNR
jgi:hypothetical protein